MTKKSTRRKDKEESLGILSVLLLPSFAGLVVFFCYITQFRLSLSLIAGGVTAGAIGFLLGIRGVGVKE